MMDFVDLLRRFHALTDKELGDTELLASLSEYEFSPSIGWSELLKHDRVILLAEAGSGKTAEMRDQVKRLAGEDRFAFFVPLESLDREAIGALLSATEEERFETWKANGQEPAWFFLDAVDELKLTAGKLDRALGRLSKAIDGCIDRSRVIISCRPSDWHPVDDLATVQDKLPVPKQLLDAAPRMPEEVFTKALRHECGNANLVTPEQVKPSGQDPVQKVAMLPMSDTQIELFAQRSGMNDAAAFLVEVNRQNAWTFARRPLDLIDLISAWMSSKRLGTRAEQYQANVTAKLKDVPDRHDSGVLADDRARLGAERLALALALTRTRTIRSPEQAPDILRSDGVLEPSTILHNWTEAARRALLRRALFDPATYGRVRFHHRSVQEYLAACHLRALREKGMSTKALFRLLFAERYGVEVVFPSMRPLAAWLALWEDDVRKELIKREPEALLSSGDPETLDVNARSDIVRAFVAAYGQGGWRGLHVSSNEIRRLADPELAPVIRQCWGKGPANDDVRDLLVKTIWLGPIESCADLARAAALDPDWSPDQRIIAIQALLVCNRPDIVRELASDIVAKPASWPDKVVYGAAADLFPEFITVNELIALMEQTPEPKQSSEGFGWVSRQIVETLDPRSELAVSLRDGMANLVWRGRDPTQESYDIRSKFDYLAPALAMLCDRQLSENSSASHDNLIRACVIASRFNGGEGGERETVVRLKEQFTADAALRSRAFWAELAFTDEAVPTSDDWRLYFCTENKGLTGLLTEADRPWLESALADGNRPERRAVALHASIDLWHRRGRAASEMNTIRAHLTGNEALIRVLEKHTEPPKENEELREMERDNQRHRDTQIRREAQRLEDWKTWRDALISDPSDAFSAERLGTTIFNIYSWLGSCRQDRTRHDVWDKNALTAAFGPDIAGRAEKAFVSLWRKTKPVLWSARPVEARVSGSTLRDWIHGLLGVSAEAATPGWTDSLSSEDARTAATYATIELNGFAPFIATLAKTHSAEVNEVIGGEVKAELRVAGDHDNLPALQDLTHADGILKQLLVPRLIAELNSWPSDFTYETGPRWAHHLEQVLRILGAANGEADRKAIARECAKRYETDPHGPLALVWLKGLFRSDAVQGTRALIEEFVNDSDPRTRERAIETFAEIFGVHDSVVLEIADHAQRAQALGQLVRRAYAFIRPEDDRVHEGVYSPDMRDYAERTRSLLLFRLLDTPGPEARSVALTLADEDDFTHFPDRLRLLVRERAATDAEFAPLTPEDVIALEKCLEAPPQDRDGLFKVMMDRLDDLDHDLADYDFSDRQTVRNITEEAEMRRTLTWRIDAKANGVYRVTQEEEVADRRRTDIRILATKGEQKAVMEVKIADKWSLTKLKRALREQLVEGYLRHSNCKAGCLLLTYHGRKGYWVPGTGIRLRFPEVVELLKQKARALETETQHDIRISVFGLDLTDSRLELAIPQVKLCPL